MILGVLRIGEGNEGFSEHCSIVEMDKGEEGLESVGVEQVDL